MPSMYLSLSSKPSASSACRRDCVICYNVTCCDVLCYHVICYHVTIPHNAASYNVTCYNVTSYNVLCYNVTSYKLILTDITGERLYRNSEAVYMMRSRAIEEELRKERQEEDTHCTFRPSLVDDNGKFSQVPRTRHA